MLPKSRKLPQGAVFSGGPKNKAKAGPFLVYWRDNKKGKNRYGVSVGRKTEPLATRRNRIKRVVYGWLGEASGDSKDFLIVVLPEFYKTAQKAAKQEVLKAISKIK